MNVYINKNYLVTLTCLQILSELRSVTSQGTWRKASCSAHQSHNAILSKDPRIPVNHMERPMASSFLFVNMCEKSTQIMYERF